MVSEHIRFRPHSVKQEELVFSNSQLTLAGTGTQWGKSQGGSLWFKRQIHSHDLGSNFLMMSPNYKIMQQSTLPYFLSYMQNLGRYNKVDAAYPLAGGGSIFMRTATDPDSIVGVPNVKAYWLDEAGKVSLYFWENIQARAAVKNAKGLLTTSPYSLNWLHKDLIKPKLAGRLPNLKLIQAASWENPYHSLFDPVKRAAIRATIDDRRFRMLFGGEWDRMQGLVYDCWDEQENVIDAFQLPPGTRFVAGVDWGFTDPFVISVRGITPEGRHYGVSEFYKTGLTVADMVQVARQKKEVWGISTFYCDPSQPGHIEEFNRAGCTAIGADNDIRRGIDLHYELIKTRLYKEFRGACPHADDERETYHYPEPKELKPDQASKEQLPVGQNDHVLDSQKYCTIMTFRSHQKHTPKTPEVVQNTDAQRDRIERLKRRPQLGGSERWSES
jgi:hypothetical protein